MKSRIYFFVLLAFFGLTAAGQGTVIDLTFTAGNNGNYVRLDSIKIMNRTQGGDTVLVYPDTVLSLNYVGIHERNRPESSFRVYQNFPNPVKDQTTVELYIPAKDRVKILVTDVTGRALLCSDRVLEQGTHSFHFTPGSAGIYFFTARWKEYSSSIKILHFDDGSQKILSLEYFGYNAHNKELKAYEDFMEFNFSAGDELLYIGYTGNLESGLIDAPEESMIYRFEYAANIPCAEEPSLFYDGKFYNTVRIFSQCWLNENLNAGLTLSSAEPQSDNGTIEKYCYNNNGYYCDQFGGLYRWNELMKYTMQPGARGICPPGWHVPADEEWKILEGAADSQVGIGDTAWDLYQAWRGYDAGIALKSVYFGNGSCDALDLFSFNAKAGGRLNENGNFVNLNESGHWWTSSEIFINNSWDRLMNCDEPGVRRYNNVSREEGYSVRCLRDQFGLKSREPVAYWNFDDNPNEQVSGAEPSAVIDLVYEDSFSPETGKAAFFNGTTTIIEFPDADQWINTQDFTLSFWVKTKSEGHVYENGNPKGHWVMGLGAWFGFQFEIFSDYHGCKLAASYEMADGLTSPEDIWFPGDGNLQWQGWTYCRDLANEGGLPALIKDTWAQVSLVYDASIREGKMYINGEIMKAQDFDLWPDGDLKRGTVGMKYCGTPPEVVNELAFGFIQSRAGTLWDGEPWGDYDSPTSLHFGGWLDEVRIYHEVISAQEIYGMYNSAKR